jgi:hypothetical protein
LCHLVTLLFLLIDQRLWLDEWGRGRCNFIEDEPLQGDRLP